MLAPRPRVGPRAWSARTRLLRWRWLSGPAAGLAAVTLAVAGARALWVLSVMADTLYDVWDLTSQLLPANFIYSFCAEDLETEEGAVSLLTYNVNMGLANGGRMSEQSERVIDAIRKAQADIVLLQEAHQGWETLLRAELEGELPYQVYHFDAGGGAAFLSRWQISSWRALPLPGTVNGSVFHPLVAEIQVPSGAWTLANVHLRPPLELRSRTDLSTARRTGPVRLAEVQEIFRFCALSPPVVIAGDFNEQDWGEALVWLTEERGMRNALYEHVPRWKETHMWPFGRFMTLKKRLDHVVYDPDRLRSLGCGVLTGYEAGASDHQPVLARLVPAAEA